eukprot:3602968-Pleurochrysis_carterae.AAC.1
MARAAASVPDAMPCSTKALRSSDTLVLDIGPNTVRVIFVVAAKPVLESGVNDVDHEDGKGVLVAGLIELLHALVHLSSRHLLVAELLRMLTTDSRMELVVKEDGVQLELVQVQDVLQ